jgi:putative nucleotidyltransferase with HDIG domain
VPQEVPVTSAGVLLELFSSLIDAKDPYTGGHSRRVASLAGAMMDALGHTPEIQKHARVAGYLHDLGKLSVPSRILRKPGRLEPEENARVREHARDGARLLEDIPALRAFAPACRYHHEHWDGGGYSEGIATHYKGDVRNIREDDKTAYNNLIKRGYVSVPFTAEGEKEYQEIAKKARETLVGRVYSREMLDKVMSVARSGS